MTKLNASCYAQLVVVNKGLAGRVTEIARVNHCPGNVTIPARGTAHSEILDMLGLEKHEKELVISFVREEDAYRGLQDLRRALELDKPGKGIAFQCPIGISLGIKSIFKHYDTKIGETAELRPADRTPAYSDEELKEGIIEDSHRLIFLVVSQGHADDAVEKAREAGASGGTIIHGKGFGVHDASVLFGVPIDPEKEIVLFLVRHSSCDKIVRALVEHGRLSEPGKGICLVLPVKRVTGLWHRLPQADERGKAF